MSTAEVPIRLPVQAVLFVGPSLRAGDLDHPALIGSQVCVRPPIRRGDLPAAVAGGARLVGIVDGEFFQNLAVSPKEILAALGTGCHIVGGASMGALRAAELEPYGMLGVGQVFEWYRSGAIWRDDDVAVSYSHDEDDYRLLTVPYVNVKWTMQRARSGGWLGAGSRRRIACAARRIHWEERSWQLICRRASLSAAETRALLEHAADPRHDRKRLDALETIRTLAELAPARTDLLQRTDVR